MYPCHTNKLMVWNTHAYALTQTDMLHLGLNKGTGKNESKKIQSNVFPRLPGKLALVVSPYERITSRDTRLFWALRDVRWKNKSTCTARASLVSRRTLICSFYVHILWNWCNSKDLVDICKSPHKHTGHQLMLYQPWSMSSFFLHLSLSLLHLFSFC
jgi:hypothetical protein